MTIQNAGSDVLTLEIARTTLIMSPILGDQAATTIHSGYLYRRSGSSGTLRWHKRWFLLKSDACLYFSKSEKVRIWNLHRFLSYHSYFIFFVFFFLTCRTRPPWVPSPCWDIVSRRTRSKINSLPSVSVDPGLPSIGLLQLPSTPCKPGFRPSRI